MDTNQVSFTLGGVSNTLTIARAFVSSVQQELAPKGKFRSLQSPAAWDAMVYTYPGIKEGDQPARVYRDLDLPDRVAIEFPYAPADPSAQNTALNLTLFAPPPDRIQTVPSYTFMIYGNNKETTVQCFSSGGSMGGWRGANASGPLNIKPSGGREWVNLGLRVNRRTGQIVVSGDGTDLKTFEVQPLPDESGRGLLIQCQRLDQKLPLRMVLTPLGEEEFGSGGGAKTQDTALFANGTTMAGKLEAISPTNFVVTGSMGRLSLPLERLAMVNLAPSARKSIPAKADDVTIALRGGGQLTGTLSSFNASGVVAVVEWAGNLPLPPAVVPVTPDLIVTPGDATGHRGIPDRLSVVGGGAAGDRAVSRRRGSSLAGARTRSGTSVQARAGRSRGATRRSGCRAGCGTRSP